MILENLWPSWSPPTHDSILVDTVSNPMGAASNKLQPVSVALFFFFHAGVWQRARVWLLYLVSVSCDAIRCRPGHVFRRSFSAAACGYWYSCLCTVICICEVKPSKVSYWSVCQSVLYRMTPYNTPRRNLIPYLIAPRNLSSQITATADFEWFKPPSSADDKKLHQVGLLVGEGEKVASNVCLLAGEGANGRKKSYDLLCASAHVTYMQSNTHT